VPPLARRRRSVDLDRVRSAFKNTYHLPLGPWNEDSLAQKIAELQTEQLTATLEKYATQAGQ
jgi:hypothetical protein